MKRSYTISLVLLTVFLDLLGFGIIIPLLPFVVKKFGADPIQLGLLMAVYSLMQFIFAPLWGRISYYIGRRPVILISLVGSTVGNILFAMAGSMTGLYISRIVAGISAANISTAQAIVADVMPPEKRTAGMGMVGAAIGLGFVFGPALSALTVGEHHYTVPFVIAAALSGLDLVLAYFFLPETLHREAIRTPIRRGFSLQSLREALGIQFIPTLLIISLLYFISFSAMETSFAFYGMHLFDLDEQQNGLMLFGVGLLMAVVQGGLVGRISRLYGDRNVLIGGIVGVLLGFLLMGWSPTFGVFLLSGAMLAVFAGFLLPPLTSLISKLSPVDAQGGMLGLNQSMASLGRILGPVLGTVAFQKISPHAPFLVGAFLVFVAFLFAFPLRSRLKDHLPLGQEFPAETK